MTNLQRKTKLLLAALGTSIIIIGVGFFLNSNRLSHFNKATPNPIVSNSQSEELSETIEEIMEVPEVEAEEKAPQPKPIEANAPEANKLQEIPAATDIPITNELNTPPLLVDDDPNILKVGFITDLHVLSGVRGGRRELNDKYVERIQYFLNHMNMQFKPELLVANGDILEGTNRADDVGVDELKQCKVLFEYAIARKAWVAGNHDLRSVTKAQWKNALEIDYLYTSFDLGNFRIFVLDSNFLIDDKDVTPNQQLTRGKVSDQQLQWLAKELKETKKQKIVFMHHPPLTEIDGQPRAMLFNATQLQEVFTKEKVTAVFAGHTELAYHERINGVHYYILPGIKKHPKYQGAFAEIEIENNTPEVRMYYLDDGKYVMEKVK